MYISTFRIEKMDCPCEENLIRLKLHGIDAVIDQQYNLTKRTLFVVHSGDLDLIVDAISVLNLGSELLETREIEHPEQLSEDISQRKALWAVLIINFIFFAIEVITGLISKSMGLVADSLDMLADAFVYTLSLFAVGAAINRKKKVALISGYFQIILALFGFIEVIKRFVGFEEIPDFRTMIGISFLALLANAACLIILQRTKSNDAHIQASLIFSSNDVIINAGVILAGFIVWLVGSGIPDLIVGSIVFAIVIRGALRILKLGKN